MPYTSRLDEELGVVFITYSGDVTYDDLRQGLENFYHSGQFNITANLIWDFRDASNAKLTVDELRQFAELVQVYGKERGEGKTAVVASGDFLFGLARMAQQYATNRSDKIMTFRNLVQALEWFEEED